jgi:hypothetical protein
MFMRNSMLGFLLLAVGGARIAAAQIRVHPTGVNVNAQGATTVFLTYGGIGPTYAPVEAFWCGALIPAAPALGSQCDPSTLFGRLPLRYDRSRLQAGALTDVMSIPPSVARRAYQAAVDGDNSAFYYVRRFAGSPGQPDQYIAVTCRMAGGGARVPLALTDVRLHFDAETPVLFLQAGSPVPPVAADITYNGTGTFKGRWEIVRPGDELPSERDLLTEATLPPDERGTQRRFTEVERFSVFLPPTGRTTIPGPSTERIPTSVEGTYLLLLRVEASNDKEGDSDLAAAGAGTGVVHSGAVAGFALPVLRYIVGEGGSELSPARAPNGLMLIAPRADASVATGRPVAFTWAAVGRATLYELEVSAHDGRRILSALLPRGTAWYRSPPWLAERAAGAALRWRVTAHDHAGGVIQQSAWRSLGPQP